MEDRSHCVDYDVVVNHEGQYSIWPTDRALPAGWNAEGTSGSRSDCLRHIASVWTDMMPFSLRRRLDDRNAERDSS